MNFSKKENQLEQIKADILKQNICPDLAKQATQLVFGDGNADAEIVFIGEAPGKNEDLQGRPFVGASGKFLNEMLELIGLERPDIYITNIVKYRPPNNRDPLPAEKVAFLPYLQAQLEVIQPKIVVPLGRHSMNCFLPDLQISKAHGHLKRTKIRFSRWKIVDSSRENSTEDSNYHLPPTIYQELVILPLYHPAAALYNGAMRQTLIDDFLKIPSIIEQIKNPTKTP
jgi:uracil-DNA glycosylase